MIIVIIKKWVLTRRFRRGKITPCPDSGSSLTVWFVKNLEVLEMKEAFKEIEITVVYLEAEDVITDSPIILPDDPVN